MLALCNLLAGFYINPREVHGDADQALAVVDHDAVALVIELLREDDGAGVAGVDGSAEGRAEIHAFVDAGEFAVEGAAGAEAVGGLGGYGCQKAAGPEGRAGGSGLFFLEDLVFEFAFGFDDLECFRIGLYELGRDG